MKLRSFVAVMFGALVLYGFWVIFVQNDIAGSQPRVEATPSQIKRAGSVDNVLAVNEEADEVGSSKKPRIGGPANRGSESIFEQLPPLADERYVSSVDIEAYQGYSDEELSELGKSGDRVALHVLADRAGWEADYDGYEDYMIQAVDYGSATAASMLSGFNSTVKIELAKNPEEILQAATDSVAWLALAQIQGVEGQDWMFTALIQDLSDREIEIDVGRVKQRVKVLADGIRSRRDTLGLRFPTYFSKENIARVVDAKMLDQ